MKTLDAMSVIGQGFDTCALNMSLKRFKRSSYNFTNIVQRVRTSVSKLRVIGSIPIIRAMLGAKNLCVKKLMITVYKLKTSKRYGSRLITFSLKHPAYGAWHPFYMEAE